MAFEAVNKILKTRLNSSIPKMVYYSNLSVEACGKKYKSYTNLFSNINNTNQNHLKKFFQSFRATKNFNIYKNLTNNQDMFHTRYSTEPAKKSSLGRHQYHEETEKAVNNQISAEYDAAFAYLSMACYFGRTEIALPGCQGFFMDMYEEELGHAMVFVNYQLLRGAGVMLCPINMPESQDWKGIVNAFTASLDMEKLIKEKLVCLFDIAEKHKDLQVMDIVSTQFMEEQNRSICEMARLLARAKMVKDPVGEYLFDKMLYNSFVKKSKNNLMYEKKLEDAAEKKVYK